MKSQAVEFGYYQGAVLKVLSRHIGRAKAINMAALFLESSGRSPGAPSPAPGGFARWWTT